MRSIAGFYVPLVSIAMMAATAFGADSTSNELCRSPGSFQLVCDDSDAVAAHKMALETVQSNVRPWRHGLLRDEAPALMAGGAYHRPWTRDASYNTLFAAALVCPQVAKNTLVSVLIEDEKSREVRIDGQYWDAISWVTGAWAYFATTRDMEFLQLAYEATGNSLDFFRATQLDDTTGLFIGPGWSDGVAGYPPPYNNAGGSSFILDYVKANPGVDKIRMRALSTNCLYANAYRLAARMAQTLGAPRERTAELDAHAASVAAAINRHLWLGEKGRYAYFLDTDGRLDEHMEGLGHAHAVLFGIAGPGRAAAVLENQYIAPYGIPCTWPPFPRFEGSIGRHSGTVWPQIQGFWALAAASQGRRDLLDHEFNKLTEMALRSNDFREIYDPTNGDPRGGLQVGRETISQPRQTWAATAWLAMLYQGVIGMRFEPDCLTFKPLVPQRLGGVALQGVKYRNMTLDISIHGEGTRLQSLSLDGTVQACPTIDGSLQGEHSIQIWMADPK